MVGLCLADFIYLADLSLVAATSLNLKSWPFGSALCHFYHGTETTGMFFRVIMNYRVAVFLSTGAWATAIACSLPLYLYAKEGRSKAH
ncbi:hypothetical protein COOONC_00273 [Cooperia oncophora]